MCNELKYFYKTYSKPHSLNFINFDFIFILLNINCIVQPPWEDWPAWPPPPTWKYPEPFDAMHEACQPHKLPPNIEMAYGPPLPWLVKVCMSFLSYKVLII